ncbi:transcriptional regulator GlxA family with amidase domain [Paraburkholderia youngii]
MVHHVGFVVFPGFQVMGLTMLTTFEVANVVLGEDVYHTTLLSEHGGLVRSSTGFCVETDPFGEARFDTVIIGAGMLPEPATPRLLEFVRRSRQACQRLATTCVGAFILAEAGLLDDRRATTHWAFARDLKSRFPRVTVEEDRIFIVDGTIWTSAGMSAGIDLALAMVEKDHGADVARSVARKLVVYHRRAGGQSQFSALLELEPKSDRIQSALDYARRNLQSTLSVDELAEVAHLSPRQFTRAFRAETGQSPAKAVENLRVEAARLMMEQGRFSMDQVARETGFADRERMRRAFLRTLGQPPQAVRRNSRLTN